MGALQFRAFKEWAVVCRALAEGRQILILRKGGIQEGPTGFEVTDRRFLLFPTFLHQSAKGVVPEWRAAVEESVDPMPGRVCITHSAEVASWLEIGSLEKLEAIKGMHIWSDELVRERFHRWSRDRVTALMVRVYALEKPAVLEALEAYAGCTSWITLGHGISIERARPVLEEGQFNGMLDTLKSVIGI